MTEIRHPRLEEFELFMRFIERAFGHSKAFFQRAYPHLYLPTEEAMSWAYIIEEHGEIVSHVGVYPIEAVTAGAPLFSRWHRRSFDIGQVAGKGLYDRPTPPRHQ